MRVLTNGCTHQQYTDKPCLPFWCKSRDALLLEREAQEGGAPIYSHVGKKTLSTFLAIRKQVCAFADSYREGGKTGLRQGPVLG